MHIGARNLKIAVYTALLPFYIKWSKCVKVSIDNFQLWNKNWVEIIASERPEDDHDVISASFFVPGRGKLANQLRFKAGTGIDIYLHLPHHLYKHALRRHLMTEEALRAEDNEDAEDWGLTYDPKPVHCLIVFSPS